MPANNPLASEPEPTEADRKYADLLIQEEDVLHAHESEQHTLVITNKRLLSICGDRHETIPFQSINRFAVEATSDKGTIFLWLEGAQTPRLMHFGKDASAPRIQYLLASGVLYGTGMPSRKSMFHARLIPAS